jgi:hypothetical protein
MFRALLKRPLDRNNKNREPLDPRIGIVISTASLATRRQPAFLWQSVKGAAPARPENSNDNTHRENSHENYQAAQVLVELRGRRFPYLSMHSYLPGVLLA